MKGLPKDQFSEIMIPGGFAKAFIVRKDQVMRIGQVEGYQVGDVAIFNANDHKERFNASQSLVLNQIEGVGDLKHLTKFYSQPSRENVLFSVIADTTKVHLAWSGARCSRMIYGLRDKIAVPPHRSCQTNLDEVLAPYDISPDDIPDVFNVFMNVAIEGNNMIIKPPIATKSDYIDMAAEMDCLVAISACPSDKAETNAGKVKPLVVKLYERS